MVDNSHQYLKTKLHWTTVGKILKAYRRVDPAEERTDSDILADLPLSYVLGKVLDFYHISTRQ